MRLFLFTLFWVSDSLTLAFLIKFGKLLAGIYLNFFSPPQSLFLSFCDSNRTWAGLPAVTPQVTEALFTFTVIFFAFCASVRSFPVACPLGHWFFVWIAAPPRASMKRDLPPPGLGALFGPLRRFCGSGFPVSSLPASLFPAELHRAGLSASPDVLSVGRFLFTVSSLGCRSQRCCVPSCLSLWPDLSASQLRFVPGSLESRPTCAMREPGEDLQEVSAGILGPTSGLPPSWAVPSHQRHSASPKLCP